MGLKETVYSVLVVSAAKNFSSALASMLPESSYYPINYVSDISRAKRTIAERAYDFIIINSPLPDDPGIQFAIESCAGSSVVLLFVKNELYTEVSDKVSEYGVFTLMKPTSKAITETALIWMASTRERLRKYEKNTTSIEDRMEEIRLVNRAKWILITELSMSEPEAHRYIEKHAMDLCVTKREIAEDIIKTYS